MKISEYERQFPVYPSSPTPGYHYPNWYQHEVQKCTPGWHEGHFQPGHWEQNCRWGGKKESKGKINRAKDSVMSLLFPTSGKKSIIALKLITSNGLIRADMDSALGFWGDPSALCFRISPFFGGIAAEIESVVFKYYLCFQTVLLTDLCSGKTRKLQLFRLFDECDQKYSYSRINLLCSGFSS